MSVQYFACGSGVVPDPVAEVAEAIAQRHEAWFLAYWDHRAPRYSFRCCLKGHEATAAAVIADLEAVGLWADGGIRLDISDQDLRLAQYRESVLPWRCAVCGDELVRGTECWFEADPDETPYVEEVPLCRPCLDADESHACWPSPRRPAGGCRSGALGGSP